MIFQHTFQKVLDGTKTQTRRRITGDWVRGTGDIAIDCVLVADKTGKYRKKHYVGQELAVQPGRGKKQVARIRITAIRREDVRDISDEDGQAEGFLGLCDFAKTWHRMHDTDDHVISKIVSSMSRETWRHLTRDKPDGMFDAWVLEFELVQP